MRFNRGNARGGGGGRDDRRDDRRGDRQMYQATCAECGMDCEVPFRPSGDKPVYCSDCFKRNSKPGRDDRGRDDRGRDDRGRQTMHRATCAECGKSCEVPFRPSGDKPVYCSNCFGKGGGFGSGKPDQSNKKHDEMNAKLDKILSILQRMNPVKEKAPKIPVIFEKDVKKEAPNPKKAAKKKAVEKAPAEKAPVKKAPKKKKAAKKGK